MASVRQAGLARAMLLCCVTAVSEGTEVSCVYFKDTACAQYDDTETFDMGTCLAAGSGSLQFTSCDSSGVHQMVCGNSDCTGAGCSIATVPVGTCVLSTRGGSFLYSCSDSNTYATVSKHPMPSPRFSARHRAASEGTQITCIFFKDTACTQYDQAATFDLATCGDAVGGGSLQYLSCDSSGIHEMYCDSRDCTGAGCIIDTEPVGTCQKNGGRSILYSCSDSNANATVNRTGIAASSKYARPNQRANGNSA